MQECSTLRASLSEAESRIDSQEREHASVVANWTGKVRSLEQGQKEVRVLRERAEEAREQEVCQKQEVVVLEQRVQSLKLDLQQRDGECAALKTRLKVRMPSGCGS